MSLARAAATLIPLLVAVLGVALGVGGIALLRPFTPGPPPRLAAKAATRDAHTAPRPLSDAVIRARIEPSVVDVTGTLTYDDETASGTGFVIDARTGLILTNNHVIRDATSVTVTIPATGQSYPADIVGVDVAADVAVLQISPVAGLPAAPLGDSTTVAAGARVISFGNQAGAGGSPAVAPGVITGTDRTIQADDGAAGFSETLHGMLATTAQIEPGDSGGPLADSSGTVIGVDTAAGTSGADTGYAIPINAAMAAERQITGRQQGQGISLGVGGFLGVIVGLGHRPLPRCAAGTRTQRRGGCGQPVELAPLRPHAGGGHGARDDRPGARRRARGRRAVRHRRRDGRDRPGRRDHHRGRAPGPVARRADRHRGRLPARHRGAGHLGQHGGALANLADQARPGAGRLNPLLAKPCPARRRVMRHNSALVRR